MGHAIAANVITTPQPLSAVHLNMVGEPASWWSPLMWAGYMPGASWHVGLLRGQQGQFPA